MVRLHRVAVPGDYFPFLELAPVVFAVPLLPFFEAFEVLAFFFFPTELFWRWRGFFLLSFAVFAVDCASSQFFLGVSNRPGSGPSIFSRPGLSPSMLRRSGCVPSNTLSSINAILDVII